MRDFMYQTGLRLLNEEDIIRAQVRYDDRCGNGHQTFSITAEIYSKTRYRGEATVTYNKRTYWNSSGGCCHDEVARAFPELAPFIKWHLMNSEGPMHYIPNALYWFKNKNLRNFKQHIVFGWGSEHEFDLADETMFANQDDTEMWLHERLPYLMNAFMEDMEKACSLKLT